MQPDSKNTLKKGANLIKEGRLTNINKGHGLLSLRYRYIII